VDEEIPCEKVRRAREDGPNILDLIESGEISLVINTPDKGHDHHTDGFRIRRICAERGVACITAVDTVRAVLTARRQGRSHRLVAKDLAKLN
jgi:carbamoyl-phosphate synthase large subunit